MKVYADQVSLVVKRSDTRVSFKYNGRLAMTKDLKKGRNIVISGDGYEWVGSIMSIAVSDTLVKVTLGARSKKSPIFRGDMYQINAQSEGLTGVNVTDLSYVYSVVGYHGRAGSMAGYCTMMRDAIKKRRDEVRAYRIAAGKKAALA